MLKGIENRFRWIVAVIPLGIAGCGGGGAPRVLSPTPKITVSVSPRLTEVAAATQTSPGQSQQFTAAVTGSDNLSVTWAVDGVTGGSATTGEINSNGLYNPPASGGTHTITATSVASAAASASATIAVTDLTGVFTYHNNLARDGTNVQEYALTPNNLNTSTFGKLFTCATATSSQAQSGQSAVYTQPLWVPNLNIDGGIHNVVFVATEHDTVYAFDADASPCVQYWQIDLLDGPHGGSSGETPVFWNDVGCQCGVGDIYPEVGVTGTPVIDPATNTMYLVSTSQNGSIGAFYQRLHALDLATGNEKPQFNAPATIAASVAGSGDGGATVAFNAQMENQRAALALAGGVVYIGWSAHEDAFPWYGWLIGYNGSNLQQQTAVFNTSPNSGAGGIWAGGGGPAVDSDGNLYVSTGNGTFDASGTGMPDNDYGDSVLKLLPVSGATSNGQNLDLMDWFTPDDESCLDNTDTDLGAGGPVVLPDQTSGPVLHLLVQMGKEGVVYLIDRDNMGHLQTDNCQGPNSQIVQSFSGSPSGFYGTPAFWQNGLYFAGSLDNAGSGDYLKLFSFNPTTGQFNAAATSQSAHFYNFPGASPSVSSQGAANGIVWAIDASPYGYANQNDGNVNCFQVPLPASCSGPAVLHAYDAGNLTIEYWNSSMAAKGRDQAGNAVKFVPPTIANGKVYVSTRTEIDVYGLLMK